MVFKLLAAGVCAAGLAAAQSAADPALFKKMASEAMTHSQAAPVFEMLTINIGPRLTASPAHKRAAEFALETLKSYGLENAHLEGFDFGRGWTQEKIEADLIEPRYLPLIAYADGWSAPTAGELSSTPIFVGDKSPQEIAAMAAKLKGAIVMTDPIVSDFIRADRPQPTDPAYVANSAAYATSVGRSPTPPGPSRAQQIVKILRDAGAGVILKPSRGEHGTVFVTGRDQGPGAVPAITISGEQYNLIVEMMAKGLPVKLRLNLETKYYDNEGGKAYNVIGELPGTDPALKNEVVMIGGHLDSWHTGVGATDNADGSTTVMEAMRLLKASGARPRRTIRVALWGGEEQGLLGSRAWVKQHLANDAAARDNMAVYFNIDNGTGPIYGWYMERTPAVYPIFDAWLGPLKEYGARRNTEEPIGSTDHLAFREVGVPGFNPIQDYMNYDIRTHHTNMDTPERMKESDLREAALAMAWYAYQAAMAEAKFPRVPAH